MKKLFAAVSMVLTCILLLTGCKSATSSIFATSYFLNNSTTLGIGEVNETATYSVQFSKAETAPENTTIEADNTSSYTTKLTNSNFGDSTCYKFETNLIVNGKIVASGVETPIADTVTTECYFLGVNNALKPLFSKRTVKSHSIVKEGETYKTEFYDYSYTVTYDGTTAKTDFLPAEGFADKFSLAKGISSYTEYKNEKDYVDNEILLLAPRAMELATSYSSSFFTVDVLSKLNRKMKLTTNAETSTFSFTNNGYFLNKNEKIFSTPTFNVVISIDSNFSGDGISADYSTEDRFHRVMVKMTQAAAYDIGTFVYEIKSVEFNNN